MAQRGSHSVDDGRQDGGEIDLRVLGRGIWRRKLWIIGPTILAALAAFAFVQLSSPYFRSSALILIENRDGAAPQSGGDRQTTLPDDQAVASQVQLIQSRDLVRTVVAAQDLANDSEFSAPKHNLLRSLAKLVGLSGADETMPVSERVVEKVAQNLTVYPVQGSRVIGLEFVSVNADVAARTVNGFVDAYLDIQRDAKRENNKQASQYLSDEIAGLRGRVGEAEERVESFRAKAGLLIGANNTTVASAQLGETSTQLSTSRTQQADSQAKADMIRTVLRQGRPAEALDIANSELVRSLSQQRSQLAAQIASESRTLLPQHPRMRELSAQLQGLDGQIRNEAEKLARAFENEAKTAGARVAALNTQLESLKSTAATANNQEVQLRALEREARSQRDLLEQMLTRYREANARENPEAVLADARVFSRGAAATEAYFPKKAPTIALAAIGAFALALFAAAAAEIFGGQRRPEEGHAVPPQTAGAVPAFGRLQTVNAPALAHDPRDARDVHEAEPPAAPASSPSAAGLPAASAPTTTPGEPLGVPKAQAAAVVSPLARETAIECADAKIVASLARQLASMPIADGGALRILTTGAAPGLDVTSIASKIAATISESGRRVVSIDAGGGAPRVAEGETALGLSDLLSGAATFAQAIHRDRGSRFHIVPQGSERFSDLDPASQSRLRVVLEALALTYDFVMMTAPSGPGAAQAFASHCSAAVLVSNASENDATTIEAHDRLKETGIDDVVVLLVANGGGSPRGRSLEAA